MANLIARALLWVSQLLTPRPHGKHRACPALPTPTAPTPAPAPLPWPQPTFDDNLFRHPEFDGERDMVRPYVLLYEQQRARQQQAERQQSWNLSFTCVGMGLPSWLPTVEVTP